MKRIGLLLLAVLMVAGCGKGGGVVPMSPDVAAHLYAKAEFGRFITRCGGLSYAKGGWKYFRFKEGFISLRPIPLNEADKMNGVEWRGFATYNPGPVQTIDPSFKEQGWSEWATIAGYQIKMERKNGQWVSTDGPHLESMSCSEVGQ